MRTMTFEQIPNAISEINRKIDEILLQTQSKQEPEQDRLMTIEELREYLPEHPARQTVYGWACNRLIPYEKYGKRLYFRQIAIDNWLSNGRQMNNLINKK